MPAILGVELGNCTLAPWVVVGPKPPARPPRQSSANNKERLYVVATSNKEDVVVTKVPWDSLLAELA